MSAPPNVQDVYTQYIKPLSTADRLRLLALLAQDVAQTLPSEQPKRSILDLEGLGAEIWEGIDAQEYVNELRAEWDHRP